MSRSLQVEVKCIECGEVNTSSTTVIGPDRAPTPGNLAICFYCGHISAVADDYNLRPLTDEEMYEIAGDPQLIAAQDLRVQMLEKVKKERSE